MNKNGILIILAVVIVGALGYFVVTNKPASDGTIIQAPQQISGLILPTSYTIHYEEILNSETNGWSEIVLYRDKKRFREDFINLKNSGKGNTNIYLDLEGKYYRCTNVNVGLKADELEWGDCYSAGTPGQLLGMSFVSERSSKPSTDQFWGKFVTITPIDGEKIIGLDSRCFHRVAGGTEDDFCLHPQYDLVLRDQNKIATQLTFNSIPEDIFELSKFKDVSGSIAESGIYRNEPLRFEFRYPISLVATKFLPLGLIMKEALKLEKSVFESVIFFIQYLPGTNSVEEFFKRETGCDYRKGITTECPSYGSIKEIDVNGERAIVFLRIEPAGPSAIKIRSIFIVRNGFKYEFRQSIPENQQSSIDVELLIDQIAKTIRFFN